MNTECKLKSNLTWPKCPKSMQSNKNGTGPMITAKKCCSNSVRTWKLLFSEEGGWLTFSWGGEGRGQKKFGGGNPLGEGSF